MTNDPLYQIIAESIRQQIQAGILSPGDRLPGLRQLTQQWDCTPGTVQHAYQLLVSQGLVTSRPGQGTRVAENIPAGPGALKRRAALVNKADDYLLNLLSAGFSQDEIESATQQAFDRWRILTKETHLENEHRIRFIGSHDPAVIWIASHPDAATNGISIELQFKGSLGGLISLSQGQADLAGSHLWDREDQTYNTSFVKRILPGRVIALVTLSHRRLGLILPAGNPLSIKGLGDLLKPGLTFVNRQSGSGTRVWLDQSLQSLSIDVTQIQGYSNEKQTHWEVAETVASGKADVGFGFQLAAQSYGLDFEELVLECYDLVIPEENLEMPGIKSLVEWLNTQEARKLIQALGGYDTTKTGQITWVH